MKDSAGSLKFDRRGAIALATSGLASLGAASGLLPVGQARAASPRTVSLRSFGGRGSGQGDETAAFQRACDALAGGGVVQVEPGTYNLTMVSVRNRGIVIDCAEGVTLRKLGSAGLAARGIFEIESLHDAGFELRGAAIDLNGEGPQGIGTPGRIANRYGALTVATVKGITGPVNAAVYAIRSSGITVRGCKIRNSGENGLLFRNCGNVLVEDCSFENLANWAIEYSFVAGNADGGSGPRPAIGNCTVRRCTFTDIDDLALGTGNGVGIGGGGGPEMGGFRNYVIADCSFLRCKGDIHFEFQTGSWVDGLQISGITSKMARQGSLGLISVRNAAVTNYTIVDPGSAPFALLIPQRPEVFGIALSSGFQNIALRNVSIRDTRPGRQIGAADASGVRGNRRVRTAGAHFVAADQGTWIGIENGNPGGTTYLGLVSRVISPTEIELDHPLGATVSRARFALGGVTRNGIIMTAGRDVSLTNVTIEAGTALDAASRAEAAGIRLYRMEGRLKLDGVAIKAPPTPGGRSEVAIRTIQSRATIDGIERVSVSGYRARTGDPR